MPSEEWCPVAGYDGYYEVSNTGLVRSKYKGGALLKMCCARGYMKVGLWDRESRKQVQRFVHRLVAEAFIGPRPDGFECSHLNGDRSDNRPENLRWKTHVDNEADKEIHGTRYRGADHPSHKHGRYIGRWTKYYAKTNS